MTVTVAAGAHPVLCATPRVLAGIDALLTGHPTAGTPALRPVFGKLAGVDVHLHLLLEKGQRFALGLFLPGEHGVEECAVGLGECGEGGIELLGLLPYAVASRLLWRLARRFSSMGSRGTCNRRRRSPFAQDQLFLYL